MKPRKVQFIKDVTHAEGGQEAPRPVTRIVTMVVVENPFAGAFVEDLSPLFDIGLSLGEEFMPKTAAMLDQAAMAYGKAAIVGVGGDLEHGAAMIHPKLGKPMRAAVGGGKSIIPSSVKVAAAGASIDVPMCNKDNIWAFDELDTMTVSIADAPRPQEIVVIMAISDGGRPIPRVGSGPIT